jgi:segregation and condensation protein A
MTYRVRLSHFEGPLDLLLHLIIRDKINIYDIPISHITREYLAYIEVMQELQLEVAGEFFVMAATLMRIKAQMLLPRRVLEDDEIEDPRDELVRNLLEYKKFKEASKDLAEREEERRMVFTRPPASFPEDQAQSKTIEVTLFDLIGAFRKVLDDLKKQVAYRVAREAFTIEEKIEAIRNTLDNRSEVLFTELFRGNFERMEIIVTFLAILELIRLGELVARQMSIGSDIWIYRPNKRPSGKSAGSSENVEKRE